MGLGYWVGIAIAVILGIVLVVYTANLLLSILGWILIVAAVVAAVKVLVANRRV